MKCTMRSGMPMGGCGCQNDFSDTTLNVVADDGIRFGSWRTGNLLTKR